MFDLISWIIYPCGQLDDTGLVKLPKSKAEKVLPVWQNIESLLPNTEPLLDQGLLSLKMPRKTGSSDVINTLHKLGWEFPTQKRYLLKINGPN